MSQYQVDQVSRILQARCDALTVGTLSNGKTIRIHNIAWGRDMGETLDHITTNISPSPSQPHTIDFFTTDQVMTLVAAESGKVLFSRTGDEA